jgi:hypothetical protein
MLVFHNVHFTPVVLESFKEANVWTNQGPDADQTDLLQHDFEYVMVTRQV